MSAPGFCGTLIVLFVALPYARSETTDEFFETRVRPVLAKHCFACHTNSELGGLRLDTRDRALKGGKTGPAVVPGKPEASLLLHAVRHTDPRLKMPPQGKLDDSVTADLEKWIEQGAVWPEQPVTPVAKTRDGEYVITEEQKAFWAFQRVKAPAIPEVKNPSWARTDIDRFILAALERKGLQPVKPAEKRTLLRRVTFDLTGLPPSYEEAEAFVADNSPDAFARVVDRLLASPYYGERWGRYWLDLARYSDGALGASKDTPYANAFRYRDWVVRSFNEDMPYDLFVKAQIAADLLPEPERERALPGMGFQALGLDADERLDVTTRVFLGFTVGCAQCHDHKYDPIPTKDYYSLLGVFTSSPLHEFPLAPAEVVKAYEEQQKKIADAEFELKHFVSRHSAELGEFLAAKSARYMIAAWQKSRGEAFEDNLDAEVVDRWVQYLKVPDRDHAYLKSWDELSSRNASIEEMRKAASDFQRVVKEIFATKRAMDERNYVAMQGVKGLRTESIRQYTNLESPPIDQYYVWRDLASEPYKTEILDFKGGVYYFGKDKISRFMAPEWKEHLDGLTAEVSRLKKELPPQYPFLHSLKEADKPANVRIAIRGDKKNPGEEAPRRFLRILCEGEPKPFTQGSGRSELAEAIANGTNPLTARVAVNRVWQLHFGEGLVRSVGNFGQLGERPTHPELLDYLAHRFVANGWSIKALHREILLSSVYAASSEDSQANRKVDPENRLLWRANLRKRLDAEAMRDSLLAVAGTLDRTIGGPSVALNDENTRRTIYATVERTKPDPTLALFDFPNPNTTSEQRMVSLGPMHRLYFLNSTFVAQQAEKVVERLKQEEAPEGKRITQAYRLLFARDATESEVKLGSDFLGRSGSSWPLYIQVLLSSAEFSSVP
jgi:mono/diheme cytochrome c family protein